MDTRPTAPDTPPRRRRWRALAISMAALLGAGSFLLALPAEAEPEPPQGTIAELHLDVLYAGATQNSLDDSPSNGQVATNDVVGFQWAVTSLDLEDSVFTQTLPEGWSWNPDSLTPLNAHTDQYRSSASISPDGRTLTAVISTEVRDNPIYLEFGALEARPSSAVPNGSVYSPVLNVQDGTGESAASSTDVTVLSEPRAELWKSTPSQPNQITPYDFGDGEGPVDARYERFVLSIREARDYFAIGASNEKIAQPFTIADTFTVVGAGAASAEFHAELQSHTSGGSVTMTQDGRSIDLTVDGFAAVPEIEIEIRLWVRDADLPGDGKGLTVTNTMAPAAPWVTADGKTFVLDTSNATVARSIDTYRHSQGGGMSKHLYLPNDQSAPPVGDKDPLAADTTNVDRLVGREVAPGSYILARLEITPPATDGQSDGLTDLVAYDFWNPAEQQLVDGAGIYVGHVQPGRAISSAQYDIRYTDGTDTADPESNTWYDSIAAAGGVDKVTGIRVAHMDGTWMPGGDVAKAKFIVGLPFELVGPVGTTAQDTGVFTSVEEPKKSASSFVNVSSYRISTDITAARGSIMSGDTVGYQVTPSMTPAPGVQSDIALRDLSVDVAVPAGAVEVILDPAPEGWTLTTSGDAESGMTLRYTFDGIWESGAHTMPEFTYSVRTSFLAPASKALETTAVIDAAHTLQNAQTRTAKNTVAVQQVRAIMEEKTVVGETMLEPGGAAVWHAKWYNTTSAGAGESYFVDVLPWDGDDRGSEFHGQIVPTGVEVTGGFAAQTPWTLQYTTDDPASVAASAANADSVSWTDLGDTPLSEVSGITAFRLVVEDFVSGPDFIGLKITTDLVGAGDEDHYDNTVTSWTTQGGTLGESNIVRVEIVASSIGGRVWLAPDSAPIAGSTVTLHDADGHEIASTVTDRDGRYLFSDLRAGTYSTVSDESTLGVSSTRTVRNIDDYDHDHDSASGVITLGKGEHVLDVDYGYEMDESPTPEPVPTAPDTADPSPTAPGALPLTDDGGPLALTGGQIAGLAILLAAALAAAGLGWLLLGRRRTDGASHP